MRQRSSGRGYDPLVRKPDEIALYREMRGQQMWKPSQLRALCARLGMAEKRCEKLLDKWYGRQWWEHNYCSFGGWWREDAPSELSA